MLQLLLLTFYVLLQWICIVSFRMNTMPTNARKFCFSFTFLSYCILSSIICKCSRSENCFSLIFVFRDSFICIRYQCKLFGLPKRTCPSTNNHFIAPPYNLWLHFMSPCAYIHFHYSIAKKVREREKKTNEDLFSKTRNLLLCAGKSERCPIG